MQDISFNLEKLGINLNITNPPAGSYVPYLALDGLTFISGQTCKRDGKLVFKGKIGKELDLSEGIKAAELCGANLIAQLYAACNGDWRNLEQCMKLTVFINCAENFEDMPKIADGASNLLINLFGDKGKHTRSAVGAYALPGGSAVEIEGIFVIRK